MTDLTLPEPDFNATEVTVTASTDLGKQFLADMMGAGAVSFTLPKSRLQEFCDFAIEHGVTIR